MSDIRSFIGGESIDSPQSYDNVDPATGRSLGTVARGGDREVDLAATAAAAAQPEWARCAPEERSRTLVAIGQAIRDEGEELARVESEDTGKPLTQARNDVAVCARYLEFYGHAVDAYYGQTIPMTSDLLVYTRREPFGVVGHVIAWNYPLQLLGRAIGPALATGNASIVKPADETPRTAVRVAELAVEAGLPPGVLNIVTGIGTEAGAAVANHPAVQHVGFVGSTRIGSTIAHAAAERTVPAVLELGGKSPQIVFPDADLDAAVPVIVKAILQNAGQTCSAGARLLVHRDVHAEVVERVAEQFAATSIGRGLDDLDLGPLISRKQQSRVTDLVAAATGHLIVGGTAPQGQGLTGGSYFSPTLLDDVDPTSEIAREEVFGPVLVATEFTDEAEAVDLANSTDYALLAALWTKDLSRAHRLAAQVQAGQVYVNTYGAGGGVELPFGGFKKSGYGREKGYEAMNGYTQTKTVVVRL